MELPSEEQLTECAEEKARFCLATGIAPSEYDLLTEVEVQAFIKIYNRWNKK